MLITIILIIGILCLIWFTQRKKLFIKAVEEQAFKRLELFKIELEKMNKEIDNE